MCAIDQVFNAKTTSEYSAEEVDKALSIINSIPLEFIGRARNTAPEAAYYLWVVGKLIMKDARFNVRLKHSKLE